MPRLNLTEAETRNLILDEAKKLFVEIGYNKTTVADIAKACGFSSANVHRLFGTKAAINEAIADRMLTEKVRLIEGVIAQQLTARDKLEAAIRTLYGTTLETFTQTKRVHDLMACAIDERWTAIRRYRVRLLEIMRTLVREGVEGGEFQVTDIDDAAMGIHMSMFRLCHPILVVEMIDEPDQGDVEILIRFILRGLGVEEEP